MRADFHAALQICLQQHAIQQRRHSDMFRCMLTLAERVCWACLGARLVPAKLLFCIKVKAILISAWQTSVTATVKADGKNHERLATVNLRPIEIAIGS